MTRALIVVDFQRDFCKGGPLAVPGAENIVPEVNMLIDHFMDMGDLVVYTQDMHPPETDHFRDWPAHCVVNTDGAAMSPSIIYPMNYSPMGVVQKGLDGSNAYSAFFPSATKLYDTYGVETFDSLHHLLQWKEVDYLTICGLALDYCVGETASSALDLGYRVLVPLNATVGIGNDTSVAMVLRLLNKDAIVI